MHAQTWWFFWSVDSPHSKNTWVESHWFWFESWDMYLIDADMYSFDGLSLDVVPGHSLLLSETLKSSNKYLVNLSNYFNLWKMYFLTYETISSQMYYHCLCQDQLPNLQIHHLVLHNENMLLKVCFGKLLWHYHQICETLGIWNTQI